MKTKIVIVLELAVIIGLTVKLESEFDRFRSAQQTIDTLTSRVQDAECRVELYRQSVQQTEIEDLEAARVFENTDPFQELCHEMAEDEAFQKDSTLME